MKSTVINGVEIIRGLDINEYHKAPHLSASKIQYWLDGTPARWKAKFVDGAREEDPEAEHFTVGRAIDTLLFDGKAVFVQKFGTTPKEYPTYRKPSAEEKKAGQTEPIFEGYKPWSANANYCKEWTERMESTGMALLSANQLRMVNAMAKAVVQNPIAKAALSEKGAESQVSLRWQIDGIWFQARPDVVNFDTWDWHDLKSTRMIAAHGKHFAFMGYDMQAGLVYDALRRLRGGDPRVGTHILVEKSFYPDCQVLDIFGGEVGPQYCEWGLARAVKAAKAIEYAKATGDFSRPQTRRRPLIVPEWLQRKMVEGDVEGDVDDLGADDMGEKLAEMI